MKYTKFFSIILCSVTLLTHILPAGANVQAATSPIALPAQSQPQDEMAQAIEIDPDQLEPSTFNPAQGETWVTLEYFPGEGSFLDGYDFSAYAKQRYGESGPDRTDITPDFYFAEGYPINEATYFDKRSTIDYGTVALSSITETPAASDPRFHPNVFQLNHTYGMFTKEGTFVALTVTNMYQNPYQDFILYGMTFVWKDVGPSQPTGDLAIQLSSDKSQYSPGENVTIYSSVTVGGQPVSGVTVSLALYDDESDLLWGATFTTNGEGEFSALLEAGTQIPTGYTGTLFLQAEASYADKTKTTSISIPYGISNGGELEVTLQSNKTYYFEDEEAIISGVVTQDDTPIQEAEIWLTAFSETGDVLDSKWTLTNWEGEFEWLLTIPDYVGQVRIVVEVHYGVASTTAQRNISSGQNNLSLELFGPEEAIHVGDYLGIGGLTTFSERPVEGATVLIEVLGEQYTTKTDADGGFSYYLDTSQWAGGEHQVEVTISIEGAIPAQGTIPFILIGGEYIYNIHLDAVGPYQQGTRISIEGTVTLGGDPIATWIELDLTTPDGTKTTFLLDANDSGHFSMDYDVLQSGEYRLDFFTHPNRDPILQGSSFTGSSDNDQPPPVIDRETWKFVDVEHPERVAVGEQIKLTGKVVIDDGSEASEPPENAKVRLEIRWNENEIQTTSVADDGTFAFDFSFNEFGHPEIFLCAYRDTEDNDDEPNCKAWHFSRIGLTVDVHVDMQLNDKILNTSRYIWGHVILTPDVEDESSVRFGSISGALQIIGPIGGDEKSYNLEIPFDPYRPVGYISWRFPASAEDGTYIIRAIISGFPFEPVTVEADYDLEYALPSDLEIRFVRQLENDEILSETDPANWWSPGWIIGTFTDSLGAPIPGAKVSIDAWAGPELNTTLEAVTDRNGQFQVSLETMSLLNGKTVRSWNLMIYAEKEGYETGTQDTWLNMPTVNSVVRIVDFTTPLDTIAKRVEAGSVYYDRPLEFSTTLTIRYNALEDGYHLRVFAMAPWVENWQKQTTSSGDLVCKRITSIEYNINGQSPDPDTWEDEFWSYLIPLPKGINQEIQVTVSGKLFKYNDPTKNNNPCRPSLPYDLPTNVTPRNVTGVGIRVHLLAPETDLDGSGHQAIFDSAIGYSLGGKPGLRVDDGTAGVARGSGELKGRVLINNGSGFPLPNHSMDVQAFQRSSDQDEGSPTSVIELVSPARTDENGNLYAELKFSGDPCEDLGGRSFFLRVSTADFEGETDIPVRVHCVRDVEFRIRPEIHVVQATDLTGTSPITLAAGKPAGIRAYVEVQGDIYQPRAQAVKVHVRFVARLNGAILRTHDTYLTLDEKGFCFMPSDPSRICGPSDSQYAKLWKDPGGDRGRETPYVGFSFTPVATSGSSNLEIEIIVDPEKMYGEEQRKTVNANVKEMKRLHLLFVPVDIYDYDIGFIQERVQYIEEVFPLAQGNVSWSIASRYSSVESETYWPIRIASDLGELYGGGGTANVEYRIIGLVSETTWLKTLPILGDIQKHIFGADVSLATGAHFSNNVILLRYPKTELYTLAHELGHSFGLYLNGEQYDTSPPNGIELHGYILRRNGIHFIPGNWGDASETKWKSAFSRGSNVEVYDFMGNPGKEVVAGPNGDEIIFNNYQFAWVTPSTYLDLFDKLQDPPGDQVLLIQGLVTEQNNVELEAIWAIDALADESTEEGDFELQLRSSSGELLYTTTFGQHDYPLPFCIKVPFLPGTAELVVSGEEEPITVVKRSPYPPNVMFTSTPEAGKVGDILLQWKAEDVDGDNLTYGLFYQCKEDEFWLPLALNLEEMSYALDTQEIPGGEACAVKLMATDGFNTTSALSEPFVVEEKSPRVDIFTTVDEYNLNDVVILSGTAYDLEDGSISDENLVWTSNIDGELGVGEYIETSLSPGVHLITLQAMDLSGNTTEAIFELEVSPFIVPKMIFYVFVGLTAILGILGLVLILGTFISNRRRDPALVELMQMARPVIKQIRKGELQAQAIEPLSAQDKKGKWWNFNPISQTWSTFDGTYWHPVKAPFKGNGKPRRLPYLFGGFLVLIFVVSLSHVLLVGLGPNFLARVSFLSKYLAQIQEFTAAIKLPF